MYNKQKISYWRFSFEIFFIVSIHPQGFKFLKNTWDEVKLSHFNKVTFSIKKFSKGVYPLYVLFKEEYWKTQSFKLLL